MEKRDVEVNLNKEGNGLIKILGSYRKKVCQVFNPAKIRLKMGHEDELSMKSVQKLRIGNQQA